MSLDINVFIELISTDKELLVCQKNQWNNVELGSTVDRIQHQIKALFDPMNIMNPKRKIN